MQKRTETSARSSKQQPAQNAIELLTDDHAKVKKLFKDYEKVKESEDTDERSALAAQICMELTIHAQVEEELFYPSVREAIDDGDLIDEAEVEHASAKDLIAQLREMNPDDDLYDAKVKVLGEYVDHHVKEEETEIFPKAKKAKVDLETLSVAMAARKEELLAEFADDGQEPEGASRKASGRKR